MTVHVTIALNDGGPHSAIYIDGELWRTESPLTDEQIADELRGIEHEREDVACFVLPDRCFPEFLKDEDGNFNLRIH